MRRREFISVLGSAAVASPFVAHAQQQPVIGFLHSGSPDPYRLHLAAFRRGLREAGFEEGKSMTVEYRWADNQFSRLPELAADLIRRRVAVIVATPGTPAQIIKTATIDIPIVFGIGGDPQRLGLVTSLARPDGNATGLTFFASTLAAKQVGLLRDVVPRASRIAMLVNRSAGQAGLVDKDASAPYAAARDAREAAAAIGLETLVLDATNAREIEEAFARIVKERADAVLVSTSPLFTARRLQIATLAIRHAIPSIYALREYADVGGLMTYGTSLVDAYRQMGIYAGRILKGAKPADLPVMQPTKFDLVINLSTAKALRLTVPSTLLALADEVIE